MSQFFDVYKKGHVIYNLAYLQRLQLPGTEQPLKEISFLLEFWDFLGDSQKIDCWETLRQLTIKFGKYKNHCWGRYYPLWNDSNEKQIGTYL